MCVGYVHMPLMNHSYHIYMCKSENLTLHICTQVVQLILLNSLTTINAEIGNTFLWSYSSSKHVLGKHQLTLNAAHSHSLSVACWDSEQEGLYFTERFGNCLSAYASVKSFIWYSLEWKFSLLTRIVDLLFHWKDLLCSRNRCVFVCALVYGIGFGAAALTAKGSLFFLGIWITEWVSSHHS